MTKELCKSWRQAFHCFMELSWPWTSLCGVSRLLRAAVNGMEHEWTRKRSTSSCFLATGAVWWWWPWTLDDDGVLKPSSSWTIWRQLEHGSASSPPTVRVPRLATEADANARHSVRKVFRQLSGGTHAHATCARGH